MQFFRTLCVFVEREPKSIPDYTCHFDPFFFSCAFRQCKHSCWKVNWQMQCMTIIFYSVTANLSILIFFSTISIHFEIVICHCCIIQHIFLETDIYSNTHIVLCALIYIERMYLNPMKIITSNCYAIPFSSKQRSADKSFYYTHNTVYGQIRFLFKLYICLSQMDLEHNDNNLILVKNFKHAI